MLGVLCDVQVCNLKLVGCYQAINRTCTDVVG